MTGKTGMTEMVGHLDNRRYASSRHPDQTFTDAQELWEFLERTNGSGSDRNSMLLRAAYWLGRHHSSHTSASKKSQAHHEETWRTWDD